MHRLDWPQGYKGVAALAFVLLIFFSYDIGLRPFASPDEGRYVEIPREMVVSGDYITPRLNGLKYFEKPPLFYWLQAAALKAFGLNEVSMRVWLVIFAVWGCLSVFLMGVNVHSPPAGLAASALLATNVMYYAHSRLILIDLLFSTLLSGVLWCFFAAFVQKDRPKHREKIIILMYVLCALACLAKGLVGMLLPALTAFLWIMFSKNWKKIPEMLSVYGILAFLLIFLPWHLMVMLKNPDFFHFYFIVEHFLRYTTKIHHRYQPVWFFLPVLLVGLLPWTGFALMAIKDAWTNIRTKGERHLENTFLFCWIFGVLGFFSFSGSKLIPYILPVMQPLALMTGIGIVRSLESTDGNQHFRRAAWLNLALCAIALGSYWMLTTSISDVLQNEDASRALNALICILLLSMLVLLASIGEKYSKLSPTNALLAFVFLAANLMWTLHKASCYYQEVRKPSTKSMASFIRLNKMADDLIFCYGYYYQDFPVYLGSTVNVVDFVGELEFGAAAAPDKKALWTAPEFWNFWNTTNQRIFLLLSRERYREVFATQVKMHNILNFDKYFVVISNR
ncbi:MAG: glycosyltransferase family 39 protein [Holosporaceae bacterium]|jgi:4-amino-4-deoxy-L-arabinose transferase-like glycosyltransferase|nr:glycosyltransferase family 39 protein [Holosporaceae bacterium]